MRFNAAETKCIASVCKMKKKISIPTLAGGEILAASDDRLDTIDVMMNRWKIISIEWKLTVAVLIKNI